MNNEMKCLVVEYDYEDSTFFGIFDNNEDAQKYIDDCGEIGKKLSIDLIDYNPKLPEWIFDDQFKDLKEFQVTLFLNTSELSVSSGSVLNCSSLLINYSESRISSFGPYKDRHNYKVLATSQEEAIKMVKEYREETI